ncbi:MAG: hypothetical protein M3R07_07380, partial [Gemmatimonadota bacterium]|nr:hypothetical protein [Gemmatimonadota bacterium]
LAFPVLMIPFFFGGILAAATEIGARERFVDVGSGAWPWLILLAASVGVIPLAAMDAMGVWTSNVVISESYTVAVPAALLMLATTFVFWRRRGNRVSDAIFALAVLPLGIVALGYLKISLMVLAFVLALYVGVRLQLYRQWLYVIAGVLLAALVFVTYTRVSLPAHNEGLSPLDFLGDFVPRVWWPFFFIVHLLWSWV